MNTPIKTDVRPTEDTTTDNIRPVAGTPCLRLLATQDGECHFPVESWSITNGNVLETSIKDPSTRNDNDRSYFTHMKYHRTSDGDETFLVWWEGCSNPTIEHRVHFINSLPSDQRTTMVQFMDKIKSVGSKKRTLVGGASSQAKRARIQGNRDNSLAHSLAYVSIPPPRTSLIPVKFTSTNDSCVPFAYLNLVDSSNTKKIKLMKVLGTKYCGTKELSQAVQVVFGQNMSKNLADKDLVWLLSQSSGQFVVVCSTHCVGVDCTRKLIFDCGEIFALPLTINNLYHCGIDRVDEVRQLL